MPLSPNYDETTNIELQSRSPTTPTRGSEQGVTDSEHSVYPAAPIALSSKRTTDLPAISVRLTHALMHLRRKFAAQDAKLGSGESTGGVRPRHIDHDLRTEVRDWVNESLDGTQHGSRLTLPPVSCGVKRFLKGRAGSRDQVTQEAARLVLDEIIARETAEENMIKGNARAGRREEDRARVAEVIQRWAESV